MKGFKVKIKGQDWEIKFLTKRAYEKLHEDDSSAITLGAKREIHFLKTDLMPKYVRHEILHAYVYECHVESSNLDSIQTEELCCSVFGDYGLEMIETSDYIISKFLDK